MGRNTSWRILPLLVAGSITTSICRFRSPFSTPGPQLLESRPVPEPNGKRAVPQYPGMAIDNQGLPKCMHLSPHSPILGLTAVTMLLTANISTLLLAVIFAPQTTKTKLNQLDAKMKSANSLYYQPKTAYGRCSSIHRFTHPPIHRIFNSSITDSSIFNSSTHRFFDSLFCSMSRIRVKLINATFHFTNCEVGPCRGKTIS
jgi:hypothetical protein